MMKITQLLKNVSHLDMAINMINRCKLVHTEISCNNSNLFQIQLIPCYLFVDNAS